VVEEEKGLKGLHEVVEEEKGLKGLHEVVEEEKGLSVVAVVKSRTYSFNLIKHRSIRCFFLFNFKVSRKN
ncbi:MAG: hypothetical protein CMO44_10100, partial [Verrucomicrobiales bacterium]|nr:hypothetical protein [Verrucomicrobiales bacterium]